MATICERQKDLNLKVQEFYWPFYNHVVSAFNKHSKTQSIKQWG